EASFWVNKAPNHPSGRNSVDAGPRARHPDSVGVLARLLFLPATELDRGIFVGVRKQLFDASAHRASKEIDLSNFRESTPDTVEMSWRSSGRRQGNNFL